MSNQGGKRARTDTIGDICSGLVLTEEERRHLGMCALQHARAHLDPRYFTDMTSGERRGAAYRWKTIADGLHPEIWGHPNQLE